MVISSRKFKNFEMFCPLGALKLEVQQKKLLHLIQPSQGPTYIFFLSQRSRVSVEMGTKSEKVCVCVTSIYKALMLLNFCGDLGRGLGVELNFLGFQIEENFWKAKF